MIISSKNAQFAGKWVKNSESPFFWLLEGILLYVSLGWRISLNEKRGSNSSVKSRMKIKAKKTFEIYAVKSALDSGKVKFAWTTAIRLMKRVSFLIVVSSSSGDLLILCKSFSVVLILFFRAFYIPYDWDCPQLKFFAGTFDWFLFSFELKSEECLPAPFCYALTTSDVSESHVSHHHWDAIFFVEFCFYFFFFGPIPLHWNFSPHFPYKPFLVLVGSTEIFFRFKFAKYIYLWPSHFINNSIFGS